MPAALFTADNGKLVFEAVKLNGSIRLSYQGWEDTRTVHPGDRFVLEIGPSGQAQGFILPATYEYCVDGLRMAEEAFSRAEAEAAPARTDRLTFSGKTPVAAACQVTLGRKRGGYLAQRHAAGLQLPGSSRTTSRRAQSTTGGGGEWVRFGGRQFIAS